MKRTNAHSEPTLSKIACFTILIIGIMIMIIIIIIIIIITATSTITLYRHVKTPHQSHISLLYCLKGPLLRITCQYTATSLVQFFMNEISIENSKGDDFIDQKVSLKPPRVSVCNRFKRQQLLLLFSDVHLHVEISIRQSEFLINSNVAR